MIETLAKRLTAQRDQLEKALETNNGRLISEIATKTAIVLEQLLEYKAGAKQDKRAKFAAEYKKLRAVSSQKDAETYAYEHMGVSDFDQIEALESGYKSILSTVKDHLRWLEMELQRKGM